MKEARCDVNKRGDEQDIHRCLSLVQPSELWKRHYGRYINSYRKKLENIDFSEVRGVEGVKKATIDVEELKSTWQWLIACPCTEILDRVKNRKADYPSLR